MPQIELRPTYFDANLPPAACSKEMLDDLRAIAIAERTSVSAVIRYAIGLFLQDNCTNNAIIALNKVGSDDNRTS